MNLQRTKKILLNNNRLNCNISKIYRLLWKNRIRTCGYNNMIRYGCTYLKNCKIVINSNNNTIDFSFARGGTNYFENCKFYITGDNNRIVFDDRVTAYNAVFVIEDDGNTISVGYKTLFAGEIELACTESRRIMIGEKCLFSADVDIRTGDSHSIVNMDGKRINAGEDVILHDRIWVGRRVMILKGSEIQSCSVVGAGSIVTKKYEKGHVALAGVPAGIIKEGIDWKHERL